MSQSSFVYALSYPSVTFLPDLLHRVESCPAANQTQPGAAYETLAEATYPEMAKYPDETAYIKKDGSFDDEGFSKVYDAWWADKRARRDIDIDRENVQSFVRASTGAMLESGNGGNFVYSPLNVYMALSMLAECTDGDSRTQISIWHRFP